MSLSMAHERATGGHSLTKWCWPMIDPSVPHDWRASASRWPVRGQSLANRWPSQWAIKGKSLAIRWPING
eukprot:1830119-Lingulodinium_polyedra.AAC.1